MRWIKMFEDFSGSMGSVEQVVTHLMEELGLDGIECTRQQYGPVSTWTIPLEGSPGVAFDDLRDLVESHGEMLAHELPGAVLGIMMHTADTMYSSYLNSKKELPGGYFSAAKTSNPLNNVTSISVFPKGVKESLYEWLDSRFGNLEVRKEVPVIPHVTSTDAADETKLVEIGDGETDYFWYTEEDEPELSVLGDVYDPLLNIAFGYGYFMNYGTEDGHLGQKPAVWWEKDRNVGDFVLDWFNSRYGKVLYPGKPPIAYIDLV